MSKPIKQHYSVWDELQASPTEPLPAENIAYTVGGMREALAAIEQDPEPGNEHWRTLSDCVNMMEQLQIMGLIDDEHGLLHDAVAAMAAAAERKQQHGRIRFDGPGVHAMRGLVDDYEMVINALPARTMIRCHRQATRRIAAILRGARQPHDRLVTL